MIEINSGLVFYTAAIGLILIGIAGLVMSTHLVRMIFGLALLESGANLLLVVVGYRAGAAAPIIVNGNIPPAMVDPVPQALVLTAIVIGVGVLALALALALRVQRAYGTLDIREIHQRLEKEIADNAGIPLPASENAPEQIPVAMHQPAGRT